MVHLSCISKKNCIRYLKVLGYIVYYLSRGEEILVHSKFFDESSITAECAGQIFMSKASEKIFAFLIKFIKERLFSLGFGLKFVSSGSFVEVRPEQTSGTVSLLSGLGMVSSDAYVLLLKIITYLKMFKIVHHAYTNFWS